MRHRLLLALMRVVIVASAPVIAAEPPCTLRADEQTLRAGQATLALPDSSALIQTLGGVGLSAAGRLTQGAQRYSVWRITNTGLASRQVELARGARRFELLTPPRSETFVRSSDTQSPHALRAGGHLVELAAPSARAWRDARAVRDSLCDEPTTALWVTRAAGLARISPVDGAALLDLPLEGNSGALALDESNGNVWTLRDGWLRAHDPRGRLLIEVHISGAHRPDEDARLAVDSASASVWIASGKDLRRVAYDGAVLASVAVGAEIREIVLDSFHSLIWIGTRAGVATVEARAEGTVPVSALPFVAIRGGVRALAVDDTHHEAWVAGGDGALLRLDTDGGVSVSRASALDAADSIAPDGSGGLWAADARGLTHLDAAGRTNWSTRLPHRVSPQRVRIAADPHTATLWVLTPEVLQQFSLAAREPILSVEPVFGIEIESSAGQEDLALFADRVPPFLEIIAPPANGEITERRPRIELSLADEAGAIDFDSVQVFVDGASVAAECTVAADARLWCIPANDLPVGNHEIAISAADDSGNRSPPVSRPIHIAAPPAPPVVPPTESEFDVLATPSGAIAPASITFEAFRFTSVPVMSVEYDFDGDGSIDLETSGEPGAVSHVYPSPGTWNARIRIRDESDHVSTATVVVTIGSRIELDAQLRVIWNDFLSALRRGDASAAALLLADESRERYASALSLPVASLTVLVNSLSSLEPVAMGSGFAEYRVTRECHGELCVFLVSFIQDSDGRWKLSGL